MLKPMTDAEVSRREANKPRSFDITDEAERARLMRETLGYAMVSLHKKDGTDLEGREWAYTALRNALAAGYKLVPPDVSR
jgi:hypothetical protein